MRNNMMYVSIYLAVLLVVWVMGTLFAKSVSDLEVINPRHGVQCVIVSRMFNTSVDCWKVQP